MMALVAAVVACSTVSTDDSAMPARPRISSTPASTAFSGACGVLGTLRNHVRSAAPSCRTKSVKVPPMSNAKEIIEAHPPRSLSAVFFPR